TTPHLPPPPPPQIRQHHTTIHKYAHTLHDALPILKRSRGIPAAHADKSGGRMTVQIENENDYGFDFPYEEVANQVISQVLAMEQDRKSTRLNSSHVSISYAVFCLKKKLTS